MLAYIREMLRQSVSKLEAVRAQCLPHDSACVDIKDAQWQTTKAVRQQLKPHEITVGLWQGRLEEALLEPEGLPITFDPAVTMMEEFADNISMEIIDA